jgi:hypothetical protein
LDGVVSAAASFVDFAFALRDALVCVLLHAESSPPAARQSAARKAAPVIVAMAPRQKISEIVSAGNNLPHFACRINYLSNSFKLRKIHFFLDSWQ